LGQPPVFPRGRRVFFLPAFLRLTEAIGFLGGFVFFCFLGTPGGPFVRPAGGKAWVSEKNSEGLPGASCFEKKAPQGRFSTVFEGRDRTRGCSFLPGGGGPRGVFVMFEKVRNGLIFLLDFPGNRARGGGGEKREKGPPGGAGGFLLSVGGGTPSGVGFRGNKRRPGPPPPPPGRAPGGRGGPPNPNLAGAPGGGGGAKVLSPCPQPHANREGGGTQECRIRGGKGGPDPGFFLGPPGWTTV